MQISKAHPKKVIVIHNSPQIEKTKDKNVDMNKIKVCYVGILQDDRLLLEICDEIAKHKNLELHIGGFGKYEMQIADMSKKYSNIKFYGGMNYHDVLDLESDSDVLFATYNPKIPNHKYSAPNKVYEAMALGKPIIVCNNTGVDELVRTEKIGFCIEYNAQDFIKCIQNINKEEFERIKNDSRQLYLKKYSWNVMEKKLLGKR